MSVVETYAPGALDKVLVRNPATGIYEEVWSGIAPATPAVARINTVSFPEPPFLVDAIRLEFNSPAVPDWNEVDAVAIGRCGCKLSWVDVPVEVEIYNVLGQRVARLADGPLAAGPHEVSWNGRDALGHEVAAGIYYVRVTAPEFTAGRKLVKIR